MSCHSSLIDEGLTNIRLAMVLEVASAFGAILGGITASILNRNILSGIFAVVLILTMISMLKKKDIKPAQTSKTGFKSLRGAYYLLRQILERANRIFSG